MDAPVDINELVGRIAQQIGQQVQTQMTELEERIVTELEERIDHRLGQFANALHHRIDRVLERVETLETRNPWIKSKQHWQSRLT
jgi:hypothetical protein